MSAQSSSHSSTTPTVSLPDVAEPGGAARGRNPAPSNLPPPSSITSSRKRSRSAKNPNRTLVKDHDLTALRKDLNIPDSFKFLLPTLEDIFDRPPKGYATFFIHQFRGGLTFPLHSFMETVATKYQAPLNLFHPTGVKFMTCFWAVCRCLGITPSANIFYNFFQLKRQNEGTFTLTQRKDRIIFTSAAPKIKNWRRHFFFVAPPLPFRFPRPGTSPNQSRPLPENQEIVDRILSVHPNLYHVESLLSDRPLLVSAGLLRVNSVIVPLNGTGPRSEPPLFHRCMLSYFPFAPLHAPPCCCCFLSCCFVVVFYYSY